MKCKQLCKYLILIIALMTVKETRADDQKIVAALDVQYQAAVKINDAAVMDRILANDFILVDGDGRTSTKTDLLNEARSKRVIYEHQDETEQTVRVWGDTAVVTAKLWGKGTESGKPFDWTLWFSDTYVRTPKGWRYVFGMASLPLPNSAMAKAVDLAAIRQLHQADIDATLTQDLNSLTTLWSEDAVNLGFPGPPVVGIKAMREAYEKFKKDYPKFRVLKYVNNASEVQITDEWAIEIGYSEATFQMSAKENPVSVPKTKGMRLLKRQSDGSWKFALVGMK